MGLLQGPRLMARTTKSPIRRNQWVPLGCRGHLGSVNTYLYYLYQTQLNTYNIEVVEYVADFLVE